MTDPKSSENGKDPSQAHNLKQDESIVTGRVDAPRSLTALDHGTSEEAGRIRDPLELEGALRDLFQKQMLAVLATQGPAGPWGSLVAFASTADLHSLVFVTGKGTRKYVNLQANPHVAIVLDNRSNELADFKDAIAVTAVGRAAEATESDRESLMPTYLSKHPHLRDFATSPSCSMFRVNVEKFSIVYRFQNVVDMIPMP